MKKYLLLLVATFSMSLFVGCDYDVDREPLNYVTFGEDVINLPVDENTSESLEVSIYTGNIVGTDRTFTINVDESSTINPDSYSLPETVTVPANTNEATFTVEVTDNSLGDSGDLLVLEIAQEDGSFATGEPLAINIDKICEFEPVGNFINNSGFYEDEYLVELMAGASDNQYVVNDMFADGTDVTFTVNSDFTVTVPAQTGWVHGTHGAVTVTGRDGSAFNPCSRVVTLVLRHTVPAGSFGTFTEVLTFTTETGEETDGEDTDGEDTDGGDTDGGDADGGDADGGDADGGDADGEA